MDASGYTKTALASKQEKARKEATGKVTPAPGGYEIPTAKEKNSCRQDYEFLD
jgi:hypothetical protein